MSKIKQICKTCGKEFFVYPCYVKQGASINCSRKCSIAYMKGKILGKDNPMWKGDKVSYKGLHNWLSKNFGKAYKCENPNCEKKSKNYEWALKTGRKYSRNKEDYLMLCISCHRKYDMTEEEKKKISKTLTGHKSWNNWKSIRRNKLGRFTK